jgi:sugar phosphate isomerase/epimerase
MLDAHSLVLCSGTLPFDTPFESRIEAAAAGGFDGLSLWMRDVERARAAGSRDSDIRAMFADRGVHIAELDPVWSWLPGADVDVPRSQDPFGVLQPKVDDFLRLADTIGGSSLNACDIMGGDWTIDDAAEAFAVLCDRAADHGLLVHLEFLPWSRIGDVATAHEVVCRAGRANGGVMVDSWHFFRGVPDYDALATVPGALITGIQLNDAPRQPGPDLMVESMESRLLPGEGECDLTRLLATLDEIGAVAPRGVEVFSAALRELDPLEVAHRAGDTVRAAIRAAQEDAATRGS